MLLTLVIFLSFCSILGFHPHDDYKYSSSPLKKTLVASLSKEQVNVMDQLLHPNLLLRQQDLTNLDILSQDNFFQADNAPPVTQEDVDTLSKLGLSTSDIEEVAELSKIMNSKEAMEISDIVKKMTEDELMKISEIPVGDLEGYIKDLKLRGEETVNIPKNDAVKSTNSEIKSNTKHLKNDEDLKPEQKAIIIHFQPPDSSRFKNRDKRSPPGGFRLNLRTSLELRKKHNRKQYGVIHSGHGQYGGGGGYNGQALHGNGQVGGSFNVQFGGKYSKPHHHHHGNDQFSNDYNSYRGDASARPYGSYREHGGQYGGGGYRGRGLGYRKRRSSDEIRGENIQTLKELKEGYKSVQKKLTEMVSETKRKHLQTISLKQPDFLADKESIASSPLSRRRRNIVIETLMEMIGTKKKVEPPEIVYMSAIIDGHMYELGSFGNEDENI